MLNVDRIVQNPFPGLRSFEESESHLFFGREGQVDALLDRLAENKFVSVTGTSGSGKSSLVRAGLIPALRAGGLNIGSRWDIITMRPGAWPIHNLAAALSNVCPREEAVENSIHTNFIEATLRRGSRGLLECCELAELQNNLLIVVDQFEEIFRYTPIRLSQTTDDEAAAFVRLLIGAVTEKNSKVYVVITMRSDFVGECARFHELPEIINHAQYLIPRMEREELRSAIIGPTSMSASSIDSALVATLLNTVTDNQDQLPVLQHLLMRMWNVWSAGGRVGSIDSSHFDSVGQINGALSQHADEIYAGLRADQRLSAKKLFQCLTERDATGRQNRRPSTFGECLDVVQCSEEQLREIADRFRHPDCCFLMPPLVIPLSRDAILDISHESLIRLWPELTKWTDEEADFARTLRRLQDRAEMFRQQQGSLLTGTELIRANEWLQQYQPTELRCARYGILLKDVTTFIDSCNLAHEKAVRTKEQEYAESLRKQKMVTRAWMGFGLIVFLLLAGLVFSWVKIRGESEARQAAYNALMDAQELLDDSQQRLKANRFAMEEVVAEGEQRGWTGGVVAKVLQARSLQLEGLSNLLQGEVSKSRSAFMEANQIWDDFGIARSFLSEVTKEFDDRYKKSSPGERAALLHDVCGQLREDYPDIDTKKSAWLRRTKETVDAGYFATGLFASDPEVQNRCKQVLLSDASLRRNAELHPILNRLAEELKLTHPSGLRLAGEVSQRYSVDQRKSDAISALVQGNLDQVFVYTTSEDPFLQRLRKLTQSELPKFRTAKNSRKLSIIRSLLIKLSPELTNDQKLSSEVEVSIDAAGLLVEPPEPQKAAEILRKKGVEKEMLRFKITFPDENTNNMAYWAFTCLSGQEMRHRSDLLEDLEKDVTQTWLVKNVRVLDSSSSDEAHKIRTGDPYVSGRAKGFQELSMGHYRRAKHEFLRATTFKSDPGLEEAARSVLSDARLNEFDFAMDPASRADWMFETAARIQNAMQKSHYIPNSVENECMAVAWFTSGLFKHSDSEKYIVKSQLKSVQLNNNPGFVHAAARNCLDNATERESVSAVVQAILRADACSVLPNGEILATLQKSLIANEQKTLAKELHATVARCRQLKCAS
jgi:energy-coupling factor transporter ATP-binding protein EcfA2